MRIILIVLVLLVGITPASAWTRTSSVSPVDDSKTVVLRQEAESSVSARYGSTARPVLLIRCMENRTSVYIHYGFYLTIGEVSVTTRIDKETARTLRWHTSTNHEAVGLWQGGSSIPFIKSLVGKNKLFVRLTPYGENAISTTFNIEGLEARIGGLADACNWTIRDPQGNSPIADTATDAEGRIYVQDAQRVLNALGYNSGAPDGLVGPQTRRAITEFQQAMRLRPTGKLDAETLKSLKKMMPASDQASREQSSDAEDDSLAAILRNVEELESEQRQQPITSGATNDRKRGIGDLIRDQIASCWRIDEDALHSPTSRVPIRIRLSRNGDVIGSPAIQETARYSSDSNYRVDADAAVRAILACAPLRLPAEEYDVWRDLVINVDRKSMFER